jgi:hypothetical protein
LQWEKARWRVVESQELGNGVDWFRVGVRVVDVVVVVDGGITE